MALPANSEDPKREQQVMIAQATGPGVLEGEVAGPNYAGAGNQQLLNGVDRPDPSPGSIQSLQMGSPAHIQEPTEVTGRAPDSALELPIPSLAAGYSTEVANRAPAGVEQRAVDWPPALRWVSRLNDFFQRATAGQVEMFSSTSRRVTGSRDGGVVLQQHSYQALSPQSGRPLQEPRAEDQTADPPLFGPDARRAMEEWPTRAPLLYGQPRTTTPAVNDVSDRASSTSIPRELVQDEVRRQVMEAMRAQSEQMEHLKKENEMLRAMQMPPPGLAQHHEVLQGDRTSEQQRLLQGDRALEQQEQQRLLQGDRALEHQRLLQGDRALEHQRLLQGDRALEHQRLLQGDRALEHHRLLQGDRALEQQRLLQGDRALEQQRLLQGDRALEQQRLLQGDRALEQQRLLQGDRALEQQRLLQGDRALEQQRLLQGDRVLGDEETVLEYHEGSFSHGGQEGDPADRRDGNPRGVQFEVIEGRSEAEMREHPFGGLLQGDAIRLSSTMVPPPMPPPSGPTRGDYGPRPPRARSSSRERRVPKAPHVLPPKAPQGQPPKAHHAPQPEATTAATPGSPLDTLVAGMAQIQQVLLRGKGGAEASEYDPSKAVAEFPKLPENSPESGAIDFQDWLYLVEQQVGSLASGASSWWAGMLEAAMKAYSRYQAATPIQRLSVTSELSLEWEDAKYSKLEKRVSALLVGALPQQMKEEMVAYRVRRVHQQLFRLLVNYQPGGSTDRALVLSQLEPKDCPADPTEVVASLRRWFRWLQRAQDLQLSLPDPSIQIRALSAIVKKLADKNADLQFKIALAKTELRVESRPDQDTALRFFQHLLAEAEQLGPAKASRTNATATTTSSPTTIVDPKTKGAQVNPKSQPTSPKEGKGEGKGQACKWFITDQGCARGRACRYLHDWTQVVKAERCLVCGSKLHKVRDCPRKDSEPSGEGPGVKGLNKKELKVALASPTPPQTQPQKPQPSQQQAVAQAEVMTPAAKAAADFLLYHLHLGTFFVKCWPRRIKC